MGDAAGPGPGTGAGPQGMEQAANQGQSVDGVAGSGSSPDGNGAAADAGELPNETPFVKAAPDTRVADAEAAAAAKVKAEDQAAQHAELLGSQTRLDQRRRDSYLSGYPLILGA